MPLQSTHISQIKPKQSENAAFQAVFEHLLISHSSTEVFQVSAEVFQVSTEAFQVSTEAFQVSTEAFQVSTEAFQVSTEAFQVSTEAFVRRCRSISSKYGNPNKPLKSNILRQEKAAYPYPQKSESLRKES